MKHSPVLDNPLEKKGHVCPPSNAKHPRDRWESFFVWSFICRFTQLRGKVDGLESAMDFEDALLSLDPHPVMTQILARFVLNLRPQTRNVSSDVISTTVAAVLLEFLKTNERTVFWSDEANANLDPFHDLGIGFWGADWDLKLKILRQLVELQLCHSTEIKSTIDRAWGVVHNKHKKNETTPAPPPPEDPNSRENLQLVPLGQDCQRKRYWVVDDSPRVYSSSNPWKITAVFQSVSSSRDEYVALTEKLKQNGPPDTKGADRRSKLEHGHIALTKALEDRLPVIDAELARIQRARKKIAQRNLLIAQAEVRETRTRRRTTRPDYAYLNDPEEDDRDEYKYREEEDEDFNDDSDSLNHDGPSTRRRLRSEGTRKSSRATKSNSNSQKPDDWAEWQGGRRSTRLVAQTDPHPPPPPKRARTADSTGSSADGPTPITPVGSNSIKVRIGGAAALKPTETVVEAVAGKKKSKFWVYAVEPVVNAIARPGDQDTSALPPPSSDYEMSDSAGPSMTDGQTEDVPMDDEEPTPSTEYGAHISYKRSVGGSVSSSMDGS